MSTCADTPAIPTADTTRASARFQVDDMTCAHCAGTIRNALESGMADVECIVDLESHIVTVAGDPVRAEAIIRDAGYEPKLLAV